MSNSLNINMLPGDIQEALRQTFGDAADSSSNLADLFGPEESSSVPPVQSNDSPIPELITAVTPEVSDPPQPVLASALQTALEEMSTHRAEPMEPFSNEAVQNVLEWLNLPEAPEPIVEQEVPQAPAPVRRSRGRRVTAAPVITEVTPTIEETVVLDLEQPTSQEPVNTMQAETEEIIPLEVFFKNPETNTEVVNNSIESAVLKSAQLSEAQAAIQFDTKVVSESQLRYSDAEWFNNVNNFASNVAIIGAGGIGSWVALLLSKFSINIRLHDSDRFEKVNQAGQIFLAEHLGMQKSAAISNLCRAVNSESRISSYGHWEGSSSNLPPIVIVAVDNMYVRKQAFNAWWSRYRTSDNALFIDARLAAELYQIYTIRSKDIRAKERYLKEWFPDADADETPCSYKQTAYVAAMLGGRIVNNFVNYFSNQGADLIPRIVPFYIEYEAFGMERVVNYA